MKRMQLFFLIFFLLAVPWTFPPASASETSAQNTIQNLEALVQSMTNLSRMISATREVMEGPGGVGRERELKARLNELQMKLQVMEGSFEQLSAGVGLDALKKEKERGVDWNRELGEFLAPIMSEVKKMTSRPRQKEAGASSLDMAILAEFNGKAGSKYWVLERAIQRICVDVCNHHDWVIPFQQVSVHMAGS